MKTDRTDTRRGITYMLFASFLFALTMLFAKLLSSSMGSVEVTFWRNAIGLIAIGMFVLRKPMQNVGGRPFTLVFRGVIGTLALLTFFYTISTSTLSNAIVYAKTEPIFTSLLAFFLLGEKLKLPAIFSVFIGFAGVAMLSGMNMGYLHIMGILTGLLSALAYTSVRSLKAYYDERTVVLSFMLSGVLIPALLMIISEYTTSELFAFALSRFTIPHGVDWIWIILMGIAAAYGQIYMTRAYFYAKAGIVSTASYSVILFATLFGMMLGDLLPTPMVIAGGFLIVLSGVILSRQK
ncbi:MAG: DMT family transporter [Sulfuricurvum sp.]|uniref:DMT family transporter n=1 Tax=Sulfuricurvum sp. TaxID=2025608 RepID=UPI0026069BCE|nr:DMT family transporter [Sulfuricurvum sp.]MDD2369477.1 DMT family transporter [Sulfuricurvum sp.]MDD2950302.1 DMT family transporter [Sulfuricurvum sp.]MDD5117544.1 DMT family transporter [Sulfuricurvum sp.]